MKLARAILWASFGYIFGALLSAAASSDVVHDIGHASWLAACGLMLFAMAYCGDMAVRMFGEFWDEVRVRLKDAGGKS